MLSKIKIIISFLVLVTVSFVPFLSSYGQSPSQLNYHSDELLTEKATFKSYTFLTTQLFEKFKDGGSFKEIEKLINYEILAYELLTESIIEFLSHNLEKFDPTTGDTCCQTRTHKMMNLVRDEKLRNHLQEILIQSQKNTQRFKNTKFIIERMVQNQMPLDEIKKIKRYFTTRINNSFIRGNFINMDSGKNTISSIDQDDNSFSSKFHRYFKLHDMNINNDIAFITNSYIVSKFHSENEEILKKKQQELFSRFHFFNQKVLINLINDSRKKLSQMTDQHMDVLSTKIHQRSCLPDEENRQKEEKDFASALTHQVYDQDLKGHISQMYQIIKQIGHNPPFQSRSVYSSYFFQLLDYWQNDIPVLLKMLVICPDHGLHKMEHLYVKGENPLDFDLYLGEISQNKEFLQSFIPVMEGVSDLTDKYKGSSFQDLSAHVQQLFELQGKEISSTSPCRKLKDHQENLLQHDLYSIIMANGAKHPQFIDKNQQINFNNLSNDPHKKFEKLFHYFCQQAENLGLCAENMKMLRLTHIYPSQLEKSLGKVAVEVQNEFFNHNNHQVIHQVTLGSGQDDKINFIENTTELNSISQLNRQNSEKSLLKLNNHAKEDEIKKKRNFKFN